MLFDAHGRPIQASYSNSTTQSEHHKVAADSVKDQPADDGSEPPQRSISENAAISSQTNKSESYEEKNYRLQKRGLVVQIFLCVFTALAFGAAAYYAHIASIQARIMQQQLDTTDRPWLEIVGVNASDIHFMLDSTEIATAITILAKNIGRSAALDVRVRSSLIVGGLNSRGELLTEKDAACNTDIPESAWQTFILFPDQSSGERLTRVFNEHIEDRNVIVNPMRSGSSYIDIALVGCLTYRGYTSELLHHSGFIYRFGIKQEGTPATYDPYFLIGKDVSRSEVVLIKSERGFDAN